MKRKLTLKSLLISSSIVSLFAFGFVNFQSNQMTGKPLAALDMNSNQMESDDTDSNNIPVPDVTVLGRVLEIAQRLLGRN